MMKSAHQFNLYAKTRSATSYRTCLSLEAIFPYLSTPILYGDSSHIKKYLESPRTIYKHRILALSCFTHCPRRNTYLLSSRESKTK